MDVNTTLGVAASATVVVGAIGAAARHVGRKIGKLADNWEQVQEDLYGLPARRGRERVVGGLERLGKAEATLVAHDLRISATDSRLSALEHRLYPSSPGVPDHAA